MADTRILFFIFFCFYDGYTHHFGVETYVFGDEKSNEDIAISLNELDLPFSKMADTDFGFYLFLLLWQLYSSSWYQNICFWGREIKWRHCHESEPSGSAIIQDGGHWFWFLFLSGSMTGMHAHHFVVETYVFGDEESKKVRAICQNPVGQPFFHGGFWLLQKSFRNLKYVYQMTARNHSGPNDEGT